MSMMPDTRRLLEAGRRKLRLRPTRIFRIMVENFQIQAQLACAAHQVCPASRKAAIFSA